MFSPNKTSAVYEKTSPRFDLRWKPTGRIFKSVSLRWIPTRKLFDSCTSKVDSEPPHGSNVDIPNIHACKQTLDVSAGTSINVQKEQSLDLSAEVHQAAETVTTSNELDLLFGPLFDEYFNGENQVVLKSSAVTTTDASNKRQQQPDSTSSTSTLATTVTANGNFDLSYALSWKPCQGDSLNLPDHRDYMAAHTKRTERFKNAIFRQREEINGRMTEMFGLLKELTTSRAPEKEEEEKNDIYDVATGNDSKETDRPNMEVSVKEARTKNGAKNEAKNKPIKKSEKEEVVEAPSSRPVEYYLKHRINEKLIEGLVDNNRFNNSSGARVEKLQPCRTDPVSLLVSLSEPRVVFGLTLIFADLRLIDIVSILSVSVDGGITESSLPRWWVRHDLVEILESVKMCISKAINFDNGLKAIGVTDKRESTNFWSESTGVPLYNVIVWMDVRSTSICRYLAEITRILAGQPVRVAAMACAHLPRVRYTGMCVVTAEIESCVYGSKNRPEFGDLEIDSFPHICSSGKHCTIEHKLQPE
ncbi:ribonuclease H-like domain-containing protein [Tanacetum coccineum]|uniref:Ribonuclease H-like domain-containing protein n=1 Tax=Tanacetum coccineum TaxID=301880 RepID=A0ABQ5FWG6_9ASTR